MKSPEKQLKIFKFTTLLLFLVFLFEIIFLPKLLNRLCPKPQNELVQKAKPIATTQIGKTFEFPVKKFSKDKFKFNLVKAEKVELITTKNQPVLAKEGEDFLLVWLEIENNLETPAVIDSQNYFRLISNDQKKLAPDFYNGPVQVAPISTKKDQVGFVVTENQKDFNLQVGEIESEKEIVGIVFQ